MLVNMALVSMRNRTRRSRPDTWRHSSACLHTSRGAGDSTGGRGTSSGRGARVARANRYVRGILRFAARRPRRSSGAGQRERRNPIDRLGGVLSDRIPVSRSARGRYDYCSEGFVARAFTRKNPLWAFLGVPVTVWTAPAARSNEPTSFSNVAAPPRSFATS